MQEKYLKERIKVAGKAGNLGETVKVTTEKSKIIVQVNFSIHTSAILPGRTCVPLVTHAVLNSCVFAPLPTHVLLPMCVLALSYVREMCCCWMFALLVGIHTCAGSRSQLTPPLGHLPSESETLGLLPSGHWLTFMAFSMGFFRGDTGRGIILEEVSQVPCQEVLEEDADEGFLARGVDQQGHLRAQVFQHPGERGRRGRRVGGAFSIKRHKPTFGSS
jgi:hypothetical protein